MENSWLALLELFIGAGILLGWAVIELVGLRLDKKREEEKAKAEAAKSREDTGEDS